MAKREAEKSKKDVLSAKGDAPDLRKLNRVQLLRLLRDATEENERLSAELAATKGQLEEAERKLEDRRIAIADSESLAEASLRLTGMFAAAQHAIDLYGYNVALNTSKNVSGGGRPRSVGPAEGGREDQPSGGTLSPKSDEPGDGLDAE